MMYGRYRIFNVKCVSRCRRQSCVSFGPQLHLKFMFFAALKFNCIQRSVSWASLPGEAPFLVYGSYRIAWTLFEIFVQSTHHVCCVIKAGAF
eukprot:scaffold21693_cov87-Skeletonema_dohrnii-CCMP3373.AAC.3